MNIKLFICSEIIFYLILQTDIRINSNIYGAEEYPYIHENNNSNYIPKKKKL